MIEFKQNKETGLVEAYENGKKIDTIITMGDEINHKDKPESSREN